MRKPCSSRLHCFSFSGNSLTRNSAAPLWNVIASEKSTNLRHLLLGSNQLGNSGVAQIVEALLSKSFLQTIDLSGRLENLLQALVFLVHSQLTSCSNQNHFQG